MYNNRNFEIYLESMSSSFIDFDEHNNDRENFITINKDQHGNFSCVWCNYQPLDDGDMCMFGSHSLEHSEEWVLNHWKNYSKIIRKNKLEKIMKKKYDNY